jgi:hypothetical protein
MSNTFRYGVGGALVCDEEIPGITQTLDDNCCAAYGGRFFIAESMNRKAAEEIAKHFGGELEAAAQPA